MNKNLEDYMAQAGIEGELTEIEAGNVSRTYRVGGDPAYFLQVPGHEESMRRGILALEMQQETEVPVPEIVYQDLVEPFLVTEELPGQNIQATSEEEVYRQVGGILADLHEQDHGYETYGLLKPERGKLVSDGVQSWRRGLDSIFNDYMGNVDRLLPMTEAAALDRHYMKNRDRVPEERPAKLGHFDFHGDNILQENLEVTGVLDWDMVRVIDPALEVVKTERQFKRDGKPYRAFRKGYEEERSLEISEEVEEIYSFVSEVSRLSELQYLEDAHGREPEDSEIDETMQEIKEITGMEI
ncbi:MAG: phosphotransferase family protein [Candidatus Nanosalina sp.]